MIYLPNPTLATTPHLFMLPIGKRGVCVCVGGSSLFPARAAYWQAITEAHQS